MSESGQSGDPWWGQASAALETHWSANVASWFHIRLSTFYMTNTLHKEQIILYLSENKNKTKDQSR